MFSRFSKGVIAVLFACSFGTAHAQEVAAFPEKPINWIVPYKAGGGTDKWARVLTTGAEKAFGQPWNIQNRAGASGIVGWKWMLSQPADGYTILQASSTPVVGLLMEDNPPISPNDIRIVGIYSTVKPHIVALKGKPFDSWEGFKKHAADHPGELSLGGSTSFLLSAAFVLDKAGLKVNYVTYPSTGEVVSDLLGGHIDAAVVSTSNVKSLSDKANAVINVGDVDNSAAVKSDIGDVPWAKDLGLVGLGVPRWVGVHPDTPDAVAKKIADSLDALFNDPEVKDRIAKLGEEVDLMFGEDARNHYKQAVTNTKGVLHLMK